MSTQVTPHPVTDAVREALAVTRRGVQELLPEDAWVAKLARSAATGTGQGGVIRSGAGATATAGAAAAATGRYAGNMARKGYGAARSAAYRLAALRGRS